jgi:hypothetical protein
MLERLFFTASRLNGELIGFQIEQSSEHSDFSVFEMQARQMCAEEV